MAATLNAAHQGAEFFHTYLITRLHHCQTLHQTAPNTTDRQRRAFAIHYMVPGTRSPRTGEYLAVSFSRPMLRMRV